MSSYKIPDEPQIKVTDDGSHTLYIPSLDEHYHSHFGALTESKHIFIEAGLNFCKGDRISILEVGFGTGLNALLTALNAHETQRKITFTTLEKYPLPPGILSTLNHPEIAGTDGRKLFNDIHGAEWEVPVIITPLFTIIKNRMDLVTDEPGGIFDLVYFDAFGPDKQPEMWSHNVMEKIVRVTHQGTIFVTYSAKGSLKRMLKDLGFEVTLLPGPPGKRVITRAVKK